MPRFIVKLTDQKTDYYLMWSTVVDAPITMGLSREEFKEWYQEEYGNHGMIDFDSRIERVDAKGTSSMMDKNVEETVRFNRAGPKGAPISLQEIIRFFCLGEDPDKDHPCWDKRNEAENRINEENGGMDYEDYLMIFEQFPYPGEKNLEANS